MTTLETDSHQRMFTRLNLVPDAVPALLTPPQSSFLLSLPAGAAPAAGPFPASTHAMPPAVTTAADAALQGVMHIHGCAGPQNSRLAQMDTRPELTALTRPTARAPSERCTAPCVREKYMYICNGQVSPAPHVMKPIDDT